MRPLFSMNCVSNDSPERILCDETIYPIRFRPAYVGELRPDRRRLRLPEKCDGRCPSLPAEPEDQRRKRRDSGRSGNPLRVQIIQSAEREQMFYFKLDAKPRSVMIDPDEWVLKVLTINEGR